MDDGLGESHRRAVGSGMLVVDSAAVRILDLLDNHNAPSAMKVIEGSVTESERQELRSSLLQLQELIASLAQKYALDPAKKDLRRILTADLSQIWISLENSRPSRIRGYGAIAPSTADELEADLKKMLQIAHKLLAVLQS